MHIAFLTPEYPHPELGNAGGMGTSIKNLVTAIVRLEHEVTVFVYGQKKNLKFDESGVHFHCIKHKKYTLGGFYFYRKFIASYINNNSKDIDIIEAPDWTGITAFMRLKKPLVIRFHGSDTYFCHIEGRKQKMKNAFFEKKAIKGAKGYIAPTHFAGETSMQLFQAPLSKMRVIHYGLQLENFNNNSSEIYQRKSLLNVGTLIRKKGVFQLVEMFNSVIKIHPEANLYLVGPDSADVKTGHPSTWELMQEKMSVASKSNIHYLGKVPYHEVQNHIKNAHICVFPSLAETLGMVTIESMALKKAVVNTNIGWAQDIIDVGINGFMHHPDDIEDYVHTIDNLFQDDKLVKKVGDNARVRVEQVFNIDKIVHHNIEYYSDILNE